MITNERKIEILKLLAEQMSSGKMNGLCQCNIYLYRCVNKIDIFEHKWLSYIICTAKPKIYQKRYWEQLNSLYYWKICAIEPRIEWINKQIKKYSK